MFFPCPRCPLTYFFGHHCISAKSQEKFIVSNYSFVSLEQTYRLWSNSDASKLLYPNREVYWYVGFQNILTHESWVIHQDRPSLRQFLSKNKQKAEKFIVSLPSSPRWISLAHRHSVPAGCRMGPIKQMSPGYQNHHQRMRGPCERWARSLIRLQRRLHPIPSNVLRI